MQTFTPAKKASFQEKIEKHLMEGNIIRYDFREDTPLEVFDRTYKDRLSSMRNIGLESGYIETIHCSHSNLEEVVEKLKKEYSVNETRCTHSGCCQYTTYGCFLD